MTIRQRVRIRFQKQGDLCFIGHRDLARTMERAFRRAGIALSMSDGFHPKPRISFPLALAVGIVGINEVLEVELSEPLTADELAARLFPVLPDGLVIHSLDILAPDAPKAQVERMVYEIPVPESRRVAVSRAVEELMSQSEYWIKRPGREDQLNLRSDIAEMELSDGNLRMVQIARPTASCKPREILQVLGIADLEREGCQLVRTSVELRG
ncbi:MAG: TIGR03936 family radical SAM-associated protein [Pirellulaceae bacterium]|nr:TIGR03936 family radical SAM-associated protein [Planctomycetales bacterium]MCA9265647.1 TIGR03936 family radical SAM-associated protein [Planctomycetales bacterium]